MRPEIDGVRVMELLGIPGGPAVGDALDHLMEIRMEEGLIGEEAATARLLAWWEENKDKAGTQRRPRRRPAD
jgi:poly(A) polymerase